MTSAEHATPKPLEPSRQSQATLTQRGTDWAQLVRRPRVAAVGCKPNRVSRTFGERRPQRPEADKPLVQSAATSGPTP
jgi:hypothetical protein